MKIELTQGSIIADIRSEKYDNLRCKGIIISARCDFAQDKIKQFHYLSAMDIKDWIFEELYCTIVEECIKSEKGKIRKCAEKYRLDFGTLEGFGFEKMMEVLKQHVPEKELESVLESCKLCERDEKLLVVKDRKKQREFLGNKACKKKFIRTVNTLLCSAYPKFAFILQKGYMNSESLIQGLVVDLQDVHQIDMKFKKGLLNNEYDYQIIKDEELRRELNRYFFFENEDDFVIIEGKVQSPWIEYILQMFAHSFIRIGVDNAPQDEVEKFCNDFLEEEADEVHIAGKERN